MPLNDKVRREIESTIGSAQVVLFMKGTPQQPQCGFSATLVRILDKLGAKYATVNVLENPHLRDGIKEFSSWPTIPQLYVGKEFMGGCDIVKQMFNTGELHEALGIAAPDRTPPTLSVSDEAAEAIREALEDRPGDYVHLTIDARWDHQFALGPAEGHEVKAQANGIEILMDLDSAQKARGLKIDFTESLQGRGFAIENPNAPPPVKQLSAGDLKQMIDRGQLMHLFDVRDPNERARAAIGGSRRLDDSTIELIESLPKNTPLVFHCHFGPRSQAACDHFRLKGYTNVHNLMGGIDAWSREVDPSVPRY